MECSINSRALSLLMKHLVIGQRLKTPNFSDFHWSPCGSLVSIGQHFVATRVVHSYRTLSDNQVIAVGLIEYIDLQWNLLVFRLYYLNYL